MNKSNSKGGRRADSRTSGQVAIMMDFQAFAHFHLGHDCLHRWMLDLLNGVHVFNQRVYDSMFVIKKWWQSAYADVAILVDSKAEHFTTMIAVPGRIVGSAA